MTKRQGKSGTIDVKALLSEDEEFLRALVRTALQEVLEAEMTEALGAEKGERAAGRRGYSCARSHRWVRALCARGGFSSLPSRACARVQAKKIIQTRWHRARGEVELRLDESDRIACVLAQDRPRKEGSGFVERPRHPPKAKGHLGVTYQVPFRSEQPRQ